MAIFGRGLIIRSADETALWPKIAIHKLCDGEMEAREPKHICIYLGIGVYRYVCMYVRGN
jgi:hypothetical protein